MALSRPPVGSVRLTFKLLGPGPLGPLRVSLQSSLLGTGQPWPSPAASSAACQWRPRLRIPVRFPGRLQIQVQVAGLLPRAMARPTAVWLHCGTGASWHADSTLKLAAPGILRARGTAPSSSAAAGVSVGGLTHSGGLLGEPKVRMACQ